jgi:histidinol dehydrogenase
LRAGADGTCSARSARASGIGGDALNAPFRDDGRRSHAARKVTSGHNCRFGNAGARGGVERLVFRAGSKEAPVRDESGGGTAVSVGDGRRDAGAKDEHVSGRARTPPRCVLRGVARAGCRASDSIAKRTRTATDDERYESEEKGRSRTSCHRRGRYACYRLGAMLATFFEGTREFDAAIERLESRGESDLARVEPAVREILSAVRSEGDAGVQRYNEQFGKRANRLVQRDYPGAAALARLPAEVRSALELAAERIRAFHEHQRDGGFRYEEDGITLGVRVQPVARAGVYAPGGKARYPSSVLMSAIPAQVAGVRETILATPLAGDESDDPLYAAAHLSGVGAVLDAGGAQAIAALAYGTESVPRVDKIVGPGNLYVTCAKRLVFGIVDIDGIAGPSEILVVADDEADPRFAAADLLSQAEHDESAYPLLVCVSNLMAQGVCREIEGQLATLPRATIARAALANGAAFVTQSRDSMAAVADRLCAEHLALHVVEPLALFARIHRAGAVFLGPSTPEALGDYIAGPSHVLPTGGAVRYGSPLGVYDFVTRTSIIQYSADALAHHERAVCTLARLEGLEGHARAVEARMINVRSRHRSSAG